MNLLEMSVTGGILILLIMVIRACFLERLPKITFVALWGIAVFRLLIPFSLNYTSGAPDEMSDGLAATPVGNVTATASQLHGEITTSAVSQADHASGIPILQLIWLVGMLICAAAILFLHVKSVRQFSMSLPLGQERLAGHAERFLKGYSTKRRIELRISDRVDSPLTYGLLHPVILLPKSMDISDETTLSYVLTHEMVHIRRFDVAKKWLLTAVLCIHWFNPLVWAMYHLANRDIELACDEKVLNMLGAEQKAKYAITLLALEERRNSFGLTQTYFSKNLMEERIKSIMKCKKNTLLGIFFALLIVTGTTMSAFAMSVNAESDNSGAQNEKPVNAEESQTESMNETEQEESSQVVVTEYGYREGLDGKIDEKIVRRVEEASDAVYAATEFLLEEKGIIERRDEENENYIEGNYYYNGKEVAMICNETIGQDGDEESISFDLSGDISKTWDELNGKVALKTVTDDATQEILEVTILDEEEYNKIRNELYSEGLKPIEIESLDQMDPSVFEELGLDYDAATGKLSYENGAIYYIELAFPEENVVYIYGDPDATGTLDSGMNYEQFYQYGEIEQYEELEEYSVPLYIYGTAETVGKVGESLVYEEIVSIDDGLRLRKTATKEDGTQVEVIYERMYEQSCDWIYSEDSSLFAVVSALREV